MPTRFTLEPGDMIVFEETDEICILIPNLAWDAQWTREWAVAGPWQEFLSVPPKYVQNYGVSRVNLFNRLSHRGAVKKGKVITVKKLP